LGRSVDAITRNSDGAFATRQMLQREMLSGRNRLAGKRIVVWEFAVRELMFGDWKQLPLTVGEAPPASFYCPPENSKVRILGMVREISSVPRPGSVPYQEHIASVHLGSVELIGDGGKRERVGDCLVYAWSMRAQQLTDVARLRAGEMASFDVTDWTGVGGELEKYQRSECADPRLLAEPPVWGEWVPVR
jgi:alginate O-acetyltransferase complex protein AlgJ